MSKILVTYATKVGSTVGVAEEIADALRSHGFTVDMRLAKHVHDLEGYDGVVVGSAIRVGKWLPEAVKFLEKYQDRLRMMPVAFFTVCMTLAEDTSENHEIVDAYTEPLFHIVAPQAEGFFAGAVDISELSFPVRLLVRRMAVPEGDFRDWDTIDDWANSLVSIFKAERVNPA